MASTDALFCSASEWPLFFTLFSFFPWLILCTGTALRHRDALSWHLVCPSVSARDTEYLCRLCSSGVCCPIALSWLLQTFPLSVGLTADGSVRRESDSRSTRAYTPLAVLHTGLTDGYELTVKRGSPHPLHRLIPTITVVCFMGTSWPWWHSCRLIARWNTVSCWANSSASWR